MSKQKHTPGPWTIQFVENDLHPARAQGAYRIIECAQHEHDAGGDGSKVSEANARLIAAAPEMLKALRYVANDDGCPPDVADVVLRAIAKATGERE